MSIFLRAFQHLLPRSPIWRLSFDKVLQRLFAGLAAGAPDAARAYLDDVYDDLFPATTRQLELWEAEFGLAADPSDAVRRQNLAAAWAATGGQSPAYIQGVLQAAGFPLYVHEWWTAGPPYTAGAWRDPRAYTRQPLIGTFQCSPHSYGASQPQCTVTGTVGAPTCDGFLGNDPGYLVNLDLTKRPPPPVPSDTALWPYFFYLGDATFPNHVSVPASRRSELERLVLKLKPAQQWVVMLVDYDDGVSDGVALVAASGAGLVTASGAQLISARPMLTTASGAILTNASGSPLVRA